MSKATGVAVAVTLAWAVASCSGCSTTKVAEAAAPTRYRSEKVTNLDSYALGARVITDTETGDRWLVAYTIEGGVAIEPMDGGGAE